MSTNERYRTDKRATSSLARSNGSPRRDRENADWITRKYKNNSEYYWVNKAFEAEEKDPNSKWQQFGFKKLCSDKRSNSISRHSSSSCTSRCSCTSKRRCSSHEKCFKDLRRSYRSLSRRRGSPYYRHRSPYRTRKSPLTLHSRRRHPSPSKSPLANGSSVRWSRSLSRSPIPERNRRIEIYSPPKKRGTKKHGRKRIRNSSTEEVRSSSVCKCLDPYCSVRKALYEKPSEPLARPKSPKMSRLISIYERSRSRSFSVPKYTPVVEESSITVIPPEPIPIKTKSTKIKKSCRKKILRRSKSSQIEVAVIHQPTNQVESLSEEEYSVSGSGMPMSFSGSKLSLYERFSKFAQMGHAHKLLQRSCHVTPVNNVRVGIGSSPTPMLRSMPVSTPYEDVKGRYTYYKYQGYLSDLTLAEYIKWEEWWYKYQYQLEAEHAYYRYRL